MGRSARTVIGCDPARARPGRPRAPPESGRRIRRTLAQRRVSRGRRDGGGWVRRLARASVDRRSRRCDRVLAFPPRRPAEARDAPTYTPRRDRVTKPLRPARGGSAVPRGPERRIAHVASRRGQPTAVVRRQSAHGRRPRAGVEGPLSAGTQVTASTATPRGRGRAWSCRVVLSARVRILSGPGRTHRSGGASLRTLKKPPARPRAGRGAPTIVGRGADPEHGCAPEEQSPVTGRSGTASIVAPVRVERGFPARVPGPRSRAPRSEQPGSRRLVGAERAGRGRPGSARRVGPS